MNNKGNKLTQEILRDFGFQKEVTLSDDGDEIKLWYNDFFSLYEESWWLTELDRNGEPLSEPVSYYGNDTPPEISFSFATYIKGDGSFKGGFSIDTDKQLKNLHYSLTNRKLKKIK